MGFCAWARPATPDATTKNIRPMRIAKEYDTKYLR